MPPNSLSKVQDKVAILTGGVIDNFIRSNEKRPLKETASYSELESDESEFSEKEKLLRIYIIFFTIISVFLNVGMSLAGFIIAVKRDSAATYAFSADCLLDMVSSIILLWRYYGKDSLESHNKERRACIFLGVMFIISSIAVISKASVDILQREPPVMFRALYVLSTIGLVFCLFMAVSKFILARRAKSGSLMLDAVNSVLSGFLALVIILSLVVYKSNKKIWYLDPALSIITSFVLIFYGLKVIYDHKVKQPNHT